MELELEQVAKKHVLASDQMVRRTSTFARSPSTPSDRRSDAGRSSSSSPRGTIWTLSRPISASSTRTSPPPLHCPPPRGAKARVALERLKDALPPFDALVAALLFEDDATLDDVTEWLAKPPEEIALVRERILSVAESLGMTAESKRDDPEGNADAAR